MIIINLFATIYAVSPSLVPKLNANHINWFDRFILKYFVFHCFFMLKINQLMNVIRWIVVSKQNKTKQKNERLYHESWKIIRKKPKKYFFKLFLIEFFIISKKCNRLVLRTKEKRKPKRWHFVRADGRRYTYT